MIYVARHGESTWNTIGRYQGRRESQLTDLGVRQARALAAHFERRAAAGAPLARVIASPLQRCAATAAFTSDRLGLPLILDERVIEIDHGTWSGRMREDIIRDDPERWAAWQSDPAGAAFAGGESLSAVDLRFRAFLDEIAVLGGDTLVVTHDTGVRLAILAAAGRPLDHFWNVQAENAAFAELAPRGDAIALINECVTRHLGNLRADIARQAL